MFNQQASLVRKLVCLEDLRGLEGIAGELRLGGFVLFYIFRSRVNCLGHIKPHFIFKVPRRQ